MNFNELSSIVITWWIDLNGYSQDNPDIKIDSGRTGERAELRRCDSPEQVMLCKGFYRLQSQLGNSCNREAIAMIAGLCSHIRQNAKISFPELCATPAEKEKTTPQLSENRFRKIVSCKSSAQFYALLRRAIIALDKNVNVASLIEGVLSWHRNENNPSKDIQDSFMFNWSQAYYKKKFSLEAPQSK